MADLSTESPEGPALEHRAATDCRSFRPGTNRLDRSGLVRTADRVEMDGTSSLHIPISRSETENGERIILADSIDTDASTESKSVAPDTTPQSTAEAVARMSMTIRWITSLVITLPLVVVIATPWIVWGWGFHWADLGLLLGMYLLTGLGITVGFHRLFVHRSFETSDAVKVVLGILGSMTVQGSLLEWVALHRRHHQFSDDEGDPHSPHGFEEGVWGILKGLWHSHVAWIVHPGPFELERYTADLRQSRAMRMVDTLFPVWVALGLLIPAAVGGLISGTWAGALTGLIWGGPVRIFLVHHITWSINSACHLWGSQPYATGDESRDNALFGLLAWGEGWHNSHHAFPTSARHGLSWWQLDVSYWFIWTLARLGIVWNVKVPSQQAQLRRRQAS